MTRSNVLIKIYEVKVFLFTSSSGYPEYVIPALYPLVTNNNITDIPIESISAALPNSMFGKLANPSYFYELDVANKSLKAWVSKVLWVNAPKDWEKKGYHCYHRNDSNNSKLGYDTWVKGKEIDISPYIFESEL